MSFRIGKPGTFQRTSLLGILLSGCLLACAGAPDTGSSGGNTASGGLTAGGGAFATGGTGGSGGAAEGPGGNATGSGGESASGGSAGDTDGSGGAVSYNPCPSPPAPCKIMASGDSITVGAQSTDTGGYRVSLFHQALQDDKNLTFVGPSGAGPALVDGITFPENHDGHSGYFIDTIDTRKGLLPLVANNLSKFSPHIMLLMIGTNDINADLEVTATPARVAKILDTVSQHAPDTLLVVAQLIPTRTDALNAEVRTYNTAVASLVTERIHAGKHLLLVDMYSAFTANPQYKDQLLFDGLHPNDAGYIVMADVWYEAIEEFLE